MSVWVRVYSHFLFFPSPTHQAVAVHEMKSRTFWGRAGQGRAGQGVPSGRGVLPWPPSTLPTDSAPFLVILMPLPRREMSF